MLLASASANNSFNPTLASEALIIKLSGFWYLACCALASGGLIRAFGGFTVQGDEAEMRIRTSSNSEIDLEASVEELDELRRRILNLLLDCSASLSVAAEVDYDPSPYEATLSRIVVRCIDLPMCVAIRGTDLHVEGSSEGLDAFCSYLEFDRGALRGQHTHYEYHGEHPYISSDSKSLVVTVG